MIWAQTCAHSIHEAIEPEANQLTIADLRKLQQQYSFPPEYGYSLETLNWRGKQRSNQLLALTSKSCKSYLELGCWDGMVIFHLNQHGKTGCGIDAREIGFDQRAIKSGADLRKMAAGLQMTVQYRWNDLRG